MSAIDSLRETLHAARRERSLFASCAAIIIAMAMAPAAQGGGEGEDDFNLDWNTIDCGGGEADGVDEAESWLLEGTVGQVDAGVMDGEGGEGGAMSGIGEDGDVFSIEGGYWPGAGNNGGPGSSCPWDLDGDGSVAVNDFLGLLAAWGSGPGGPPDFDGSGDVGTTDLLALLAQWGSCPSS